MWVIGEQREASEGTLCWGDIVRHLGCKRAAWDSGVLGEKYLGDHGLGIFFLLLVEITHP